MDGKNFVAIGKFMFETPGYPWNVPHTHFIVNKTESGRFEATNLELVLDSIGETIQTSVNGLAKLTAGYVMEIMLERRGHDELVEIMGAGLMEDYWREYRIIETNLSRVKKDLSHNIDRHWVEAIKETLDENLKKAIYEIAKHDAEKLYRELRSKIPGAFNLSFELKTLEALAA